MLEYKNYIVLNNETDYGNYEVIYNNEFRVRLDNLGTIEKVKTYPQCYRYEEPEDRHFCGNYLPCDIKELYDTICEDKKLLEKTLQKVQQMLDK